MTSPTRGSLERVALRVAAVVREHRPNDDHICPKDLAEIFREEGVPLDE